MDLNQVAVNAGEAESFLKMLANKNRLMILCSLRWSESGIYRDGTAVPAGVGQLYLGR